MIVRRLIAAAGAAGLVGAGAFLLPAMAGSHSVTHTLKFISVTKKSANFSKTSVGQSGWDVNKAGNVIGFDEIFVKFNPKTGAASGGVTLDTRGGFLYGTLKFSNGPVTRGKVTGGTGIFKGATGTITGKNLNKRGTRTAVTITYHR